MKHIKRVELWDSDEMLLRLNSSLQLYWLSFSESRDYRLQAKRPTLCISVFSIIRLRALAYIL